MYNSTFETAANCFKGVFVWFLIQIIETIDHPRRIRISEEIGGGERLWLLQ